jgi:hypothetical protein
MKIPTNTNGVLIKVFKNKKADDDIHYIGVNNGKMYDPYSLYQADHSEGFCQMFAFFIATQEDGDFKKVNQDKKITVAQFNRLTYNTHLCAIKIIALLQADREFYRLFEKDLNSMVKKQGYRNKYGIRYNTTLKTFIDDFQKVCENIDNIKDYIHDNPLNGWQNGCKKTELWNSYHKR